MGRKGVGKKAILRNRGTRGKDSKGRKGRVRGGRETGSELRVKGNGDCTGEFSLSFRVSCTMETHSRACMPIDSD